MLYLRCRINGFTKHLTPYKSEELLMEPEHSKRDVETSEKPKRKSPRNPHEYEDDHAAKTSMKERKLNGTLLASYKPSYCLKRGIGSLQWGGESLRSQHLKKLRWLIKKLIRRQNWMEASGVLSVLLQGTGSDQSLSRNRSKYWAAMELLNYIKGGTVSSRKIQKIYELWMKKIGLLKNWSEKNRFAVQVEFILFCLQRGSTENARQAAIRLMQESGFHSDPISNFVVGLAFCHLWYSEIPKELQLTELDSSDSFVQSEIPVGGIYMSMNNSKENDVLEAEGAKSSLKSDSNTSVANDKKVSEDDGGQQKEESMDTDDNLRKETFHPSFQPQGFYMNSAEGSGHKDNSFSNYNSDRPHASIFCTQGLPPWLLPLKLPNFHENVEDAISMHRKLHNDFYKSALKHLRVALYSSPPVIEAFHLLIQMLLLGDQVSKALEEVENLFDSLSTIVQLRLKACLLEHFDGGNYSKLCACFENVLKKDPTCSNSLARLVHMHQHGDYDTQNLVEMVALHLDATYGTHDTWKELASCFLKLSQCEEDRVSTCHDGSDQYSQEYLNSSNKIPEIFTDRESGKTWRFRFRWWLKRHFHNNILMSDIASGDVQLLTHKAAAASHIYGRHCNYVVKTTEHLEKENNMELYSFLQTHILNSIGFYCAKRNNL